MSNQDKESSSEVRPQKTERDYAKEIEEAKLKEKDVDDKEAEEDEQKKKQDELAAKLDAAQQRDAELAKKETSEKDHKEDQPNQGSFEVSEEESKKEESVISDLEKQKAAKVLEEEMKKYIGYADLRDQCPMTNMPSDDINAWLESELKGMEVAEQRKILRNPESLVWKLYQTNNNPTNTGQAELMVRALRELSDSQKQLTNSVDSLIKDKSTSGGMFKNELHGSKAALAFTARLKGLKKVYLYNSGFHIDLRPFELSELNEFFMSVDSEGEELGRILGGHFYMVHDLFVKQKFMELFPLAVVGSNLKGWDRGDTLIKNISINDYDTLLWAVCSLMYRKGIRVDMICADSECGHVTKNILHEINRMRMVDTKSIGEEAIEWLVKGEEVTSKDLETYRNDHLNLTTSFVDKSIRYHLVVPSIFSVLDYGNQLMSVVTAKVQGEPTLKNEQILSRVLINYNRSFVPWISRVDMMNEDDPSKVDFSSDSHEALHSVLEVRVDDPDDGSVMTKVTEFMRSTKMCHICYPATPCAACGKEHPSAVDGLMAWDAQYLFFSLTYRRLEPIGIV